MLKVLNESSGIYLYNIMKHHHRLILILIAIGGAILAYKLWQAMVATL